jgi:hypothetical protein
MSEQNSIQNDQSKTPKSTLFKKYKVHLIWTLLIGTYLYITLLPEVMFINGSGLTVEQVTITIPADDKVWRNIKHGESKGFRYQPSSKSGEYKVSIILEGGTRIKSNFKGIESWNMGHKAFIELTPDMRLKADYSYSLF